MYGMMHLPKGENHDTARLLNRNDKLFLRVTKGIVYSKGFRHPPTIDEYRASVGFMAIPIERLMWVYGGKAQDFEQVSYEAREVYLLYANYFIRGELRLAKNSVLTSFLDNVASNKPFQTLYNASIVAHSPGNNWTLALHGKNLGDKEYRIAGYNFPASFDDDGNLIEPGLGGEDTVTGFYGDPRTVLFSVAYRF